MPASTQTQPWRQLPAWVADAIEPELPGMAAEILATIAAEVPEYARPFEGAFGRGIETGVTEALRQFLALIRDPDAGRGTGRDVYVGLGRGELRQGRTLDSLQAAYRVGARVAWRRAAAAGRAAGFEPEVLSLLAESMFAYIDELSADSVEGYAAAQSELVGERQRRRRELAALLLGEMMPSEGELRAAAGAADWTLPETVAPLACSEAHAVPLARRLGADVLVAGRDGLGCLLLPDPYGPRRQRTIDRAVRALLSGEQDRSGEAVQGSPGSAARATVAIGPVLILSAGGGRALRQPATGIRITAGISGARAWALTREALMLPPEAGSPVIFAERRLGDLALAESADLAQRLLELNLTPLASLTSGARERLSATLLAYLCNSGNAVAVAEDLEIHPQTARQRIGRLRELFGDDLDSAKWRFETELALRAERLAAERVVSGKRLAA